MSLPPPALPPPVLNARGKEGTGHRSDRHIHFLWPSLAAVSYPRHGRGGGSVVVAGPGDPNLAMVRVDRSHLLYTNALRQAHRVYLRCSLYEYSGYCPSGRACHYVHEVHIDESLTVPQRFHGRKRDGRGLSTSIEWQRSNEVSLAEFGDSAALSCCDDVPRPYETSMSPGTPDDDGLVDWVDTVTPPKPVAMANAAANTSGSGSAAWWYRNPYGAIDGDLHVPTSPTLE